MNKSIKITSIIALVGLAFYVGVNSEFLSKDREKRLSEKLHSQILQEVRSQLGQELRAQIKQELLAEINKGKEQLAMQTPQVNESSKESLEKAARRVVREVFTQDNRNSTITNEELDKYVASGGIGSDLPIGSGFTRSQDILLAQNSADASSKKKNNQSGKDPSGQKDDSMNTVAGERTESLEHTLQQRGSMLLGKGKWIIDPSTSWAHFSSNKIFMQGVTLLNFLTIGTIGTQEIDRDIFIQTLSVKYGLLNNLQTEVKIPFRGEYDRVTVTNTSNQPTSETNRKAVVIGDIDLSASRQIGWEHGLMPDLIASFGLKTTTGRSYGHEIAFGTGHYAFRSSLIASKSSDPAVIFGSLTYNHNFERKNIDNVGDVKPGDSFGYSVGTAIALSYQTAINFSFDNSLVFKTKRNGVDVLDSLLNVANFRTGLNWSIDERKSINFSVSFGLTKDSPDVSVELGFPISF